MTPRQLTIFLKKKNIRTIFVCFRQNKYCLNATSLLCAWLSLVQDQVPRQSIKSEMNIVLMPWRGQKHTHTKNGLGNLLMASTATSAFCIKSELRSVNKEMWGIQMCKSYARSHKVLASWYSCQDVMPHVGGMIQNAEQDGITMVSKATTSLWQVLSELWKLKLLLKGFDFLKSCN